jgi:hypothetical protein
VYVYRADDLAELARHKTHEVVYGAGGIAYHDSRFIVIGGLPIGVEENYAYEYDGDFRFIKRHVIKSGYTLMGIQTAAYSAGFWWFGCYGKPQVLLKTDESFRLVGKYLFDCSLGIVGLADGSFLVARGVSRRLKPAGNRRIKTSHLRGSVRPKSPSAAMPQKEDSNVERTEGGQGTVDSFVTRQRLDPAADRRSAGRRSRDGGPIPATGGTIGAKRFRRFPAGSRAEDFKTRNSADRVGSKTRNSADRFVVAG